MCITWSWLIPASLFRLTSTSTMPGEIPPCLDDREPSAISTTANPATTAPVLAPAPAAADIFSIHWNTIPAACPACTKRSAKAVHPVSGRIAAPLDEPSSGTGTGLDDERPRACLFFPFESCPCTVDVTEEGRPSFLPKGGKCCFPVISERWGTSFRDAWQREPTAAVWGTCVDYRMLQTSHSKWHSKLVCTLAKLQFAVHPSYCSIPPTP